MAHEVACHWAEEIKAGAIQPHEVAPILEPGPQPAPYVPPPVQESPDRGGAQR